MRRQTQELRQFVENVFPTRPNFAFAYGSGVFKQATHNPFHRKDEPMIDFIFAVDDSKLWHTKNIEANPDHYSFLGYLGGNIVAKIQDDYGARVYFNTLVKVPEMSMQIKYGVISTPSLVRDLIEWETLYISGRLHKPVTVLIDPWGNFQSGLESGLQNNLRNALNIASLLLPESFDKQLFYKTIAGLSYLGDVRMGLAENPRKVENIVSGSFDYFEDLYANIIAGAEHLTVKDGMFIQDKSNDTQEKLFNQLPNSFQNCREPFSIQNKLKSIVAHSSRGQTLKGIFTAGLVKSVKYSFRKIRKFYGL